MQENQDRRWLAWGLWFHFWLVLLTVAASLAAIFYTFFDNGRPMVQRVGRWWGRNMLRCVRIPLEVWGLEHLRPGQTYVFAANHRSNFDIFVLWAILPGTFLWVAKKSLFRIPIFGQALARMGSIPIDRENLSEAIRSLNRAVAEIQGGASMIVFPEGTRATTPELLPFKKGVFVMAHRAKQPIVPVSISGTRFIQPRRAVTVRPGPVKVVISPPIYPQDFRRKEVLMDAVRQTLAAHYDPDFPYGAGDPHV